MPSWTLPEHFTRDLTKDLADVGRRSKRQAIDLVNAIKRFESRLDDETEVGIRMVSFGLSEIFHVQSIEYIDPEMLIFRGSNSDGGTVELIQHIHQTSIMLVAAKKLKNVANRIGFVDFDVESKKVEQK